MMDYTTLVERLLDGTITTAEQAELDRMRLSSPDIDREVRNLLEVEQLLRQKAEEEDTRSLAFRESVRSTLKASLGLSTITATDAQAPSAAVATAAGAGAASGSLRLMLVALLIASTGIGYFLLSTTDSSNQPVPPATLSQAEQQREVHPLPAEADVSAPAEHNAPPAAVADNSQERHETAQPEAVNEVPEAVEKTSPARIEVEGTVDSPNSREKHYSALIQNMTRQLDGQEKTSRASAAVTARQIALLYDKIGNTANARRYFDTARRYAQEAAVQETEGETLGEYALFEARNGNKTTAEDLATEALRVLRSARSSQLPAWETSLKQLVK